MPHASSRSRFVFFRVIYRVTCSKRQSNLTFGQLHVERFQGRFLYLADRINKVAAGEAVSPNNRQRFDDRPARVSTNQVSGKCFAHVRSDSSPTLVEITVNKSAFSVYCDGGLMVRSIVDSFLYVNFVELVQICYVLMLYILSASVFEFFVLRCIIKLILDPINFQK